MSHFVVFIGLALTVWGLFGWAAHDPLSADLLKQINSTLWFVVASLGLVVMCLGGLLGKPRG